MYGGKGVCPNAASRASSLPATATRLELPLFLSEKQKEAIQSCHVHLRNDYENRRHGMHKRLSILEVNFGGDEQFEPSIPQEDNDNDMTRPCLTGASVQTLLEHFARAHSVNPSVAHKAVKAEATGAASAASSTAIDRGGRMDDVSRVTVAEWTEERKPTMPSQGGKWPNNKQKGGHNHSAGGHGRKRGNGDAEKKSSPRKRNNNDTKE